MKRRRLLAPESEGGGGLTRAARAVGIEVEVDTVRQPSRMYGTPFDPDKSVLANQILFERIVADDLDLKPGEKVLELGCGCGAIAEHIAESTGAVPHGINLDRFLARLHLIPGKTNALMGRMNKNSRSYIQAEEEQLLTLNWHCVGEKPGTATR